MFVLVLDFVGHTKAVCVDELIEDVTFGMMIGEELTLEDESEMEIEAETSAELEGPDGC